MPFNEKGHYVLEDIAFCNTNLLNEAARHFKKHGVYTKAPKGSREYNQFWDIEEDRRLNGMTIPGKLYTGSDGIERLQEVHVTGEHYGFLNYGRIKRTKDQDLADLKNVVKDSHLLKNARKVGSKDIDFPSFLDGQYQWMKAKAVARENGWNVVMTKSRRKGYSYMEGWDSADTVSMNPYCTVIVGAFDYKYITLGNQIMPMAKRYLDFLELNTDFRRGYLKEQAEHIKLGYKRSTEGNKEFGYQSEIVAVSFMNNPDAAVGKDAIKIKLEECGKFPNLKQALDVTLSTTEDGSIITGQIIMFGTGGTDDANWADFEDIYYHPEKYNCMVFDNVWDEAATGNGVGFFHPQYIGDPAFVDQWGNSKIKEAKASHEVLKTKAKNTKTNAEYLKFIGQRANSPQEAFASGSDNIFPSAEILEQLNKVEHNPDYKYLHRVGQLVRGETKIKFKPNEELQSEGLKVHDPIFDFPLKSGSDVTGAYVEWVTPYRDPVTGLIPKGLYRIWHDPYAHDKDTIKDVKMKDSLGTAYVYERPNNLTPSKGDHLVGALVGRPARMDDYNDNLLKLVEYFNGELMFENDRGDVKGFFARHKKLHLLANEPDLEWEATLKGKTGRGKGMHMTDNRKSTGAILLRDWLLTPVGKDIYGNTKLVLHYIYDAGLLRELLKWNLKGNFDRVSALLVGMFDMKETFDKEIKQPKPVNKSSFFNRKLFT